MNNEHLPLRSGKRKPVLMGARPKAAIYATPRHSFTGVPFFAGRWSAALSGDGPSRGAKDRRAADDLLHELMRCRLDPFAFEATMGFLEDGCTRRPYSRFDQADRSIANLSDELWNRLRATKRSFTVIAAITREALTLPATGQPPELTSAMLVAAVQGLAPEAAMVAGAAQLARMCERIQPTRDAAWAFGNKLLGEVGRRVYQAERAAGLIA